MKLKEILSSYTHKNGNKTTVVKLVTMDVDGVKRKFKFSYDAYNAGETFTGELFDGDKFNHIFGIRDLGFIPESSMYIRDEAKIKDRFEILNKKGLEFIKLLF